MRVDYGFATPQRAVNVPPEVSIRWACKRCQANGIASLGTIDAQTHRGPVVELSQRIAYLHHEASPGCNASIRVALDAFTIKDI